MSTEEVDGAGIGWVNGTGMPGDANKAFGCEPQDSEQSASHTQGYFRDFQELPSRLIPSASGGSQGNISVDTMMDLAGARDQSSASRRAPPYENAYGGAAVLAHQPLLPSSSPNLDSSVSTRYQSYAATPSTTNAASFVSAKLPNAMSRDQLGFCTSVVRNLKRNKKAHPFLEPVDPIKLNIPHYHTIVKQPMDLGTVERKLANNAYADVEAFSVDVRQIFQNCYLFNGRESPYSAMAAALEKTFENQMKRLPVASGETSQRPSGSARRVSTGPDTGHSYVSIAMPSPAGSPQSAATIGRSLGPTSSQLEHLEAATGGPKAASAQKKSSSSSRYTGSATAGSASSDRRLTFCSSVLHELSKKTHAAYSHPFMQPVDHVALAIPDYPQIIKRPMDISTIRRKHDAGEYASHTEFEEDIKLMFNNCFTYNKPGDPVYVMGKQLEQVFLNRWKDLPPPPVKKKKAAPAKPASSKAASSKAASSKAASSKAASSKAASSKAASSKAASSKATSSKAAPKTPSKTKTAVPLVNVKPSESEESESEISSDSESDDAETSLVGKNLEQIALMEAHIRMLQKRLMEMKDAATTIKAKKKKKSKTSSVGAQHSASAKSKSTKRKKRKVDSSNDLNDESDPGRKSKASKTLDADGDFLAPSYTDTPSAVAAPANKRKRQASEAACSSDEGRGRDHASVDIADQLDGYSAAGAGGGGRNPAKKAKAEPPAVHPEHKQELSEYINQLAEDKLETVIDIIHESIPHLREAGTEEVELDIDALDYGTFYNLYNFVVKGVRPTKKGFGRGSAVGREGNGTAGVSPQRRSIGGDSSRDGAKPDSPAVAASAAPPDVDAVVSVDAAPQKKKLLSDAEQKKKISELEEKLRQFADVPSGVEASGVGSASSDHGDDSGGEISDGSLA